MPNIEVYGFKLPDKNGTFNEKAFDFTQKIWDAVKDAPYRDEIVVTGVSSESRNDPVDDAKSPESQHFLRLWATNQEELDDLVRRLCHLDVDIEVAPLLQRFFPRPNERVKLAEKLRTLRPVAGTDPNFDYEINRVHADEEFH